MYLELVHLIPRPGVYYLRSSYSGRQNDIFSGRKFYPPPSTAQNTLSRRHAGNTETDTQHADVSSFRVVYGVNREVGLSSCELLMIIIMFFWVNDAYFKTDACIPAEEYSLTSLSTVHDNEPVPLHFCGISNLLVKLLHEQQYTCLESFSDARTIPWSTIHVHALDVWEKNSKG